jgi:hypothetical protein
MASSLHSTINKIGFAGFLCSLVFTHVTHLFGFVLAIRGHRDCESVIS